MEDRQRILYEFGLKTVLLLIENHEFTVKFLTQPFDEVEAKSGKSSFVGNDNTLDIESDNSFQNGIKLSPPKIESIANFCDDLAARIAAGERRLLSGSVVI